MLGAKAFALGFRAYGEPGRGEGCSGIHSTHHPMTDCWGVGAKGLVKAVRRVEGWGGGGLAWWERGRGHWREESSRDEGLEVGLTLPGHLWGRYLLRGHCGGGEGGKS